MLVCCGTPVGSQSDAHQISAQFYRCCYHVATKSQLSDAEPPAVMPHDAKF